MNATRSIELNQEPVGNNIEFYLLLIVIKLSFLIISKVGIALVQLYKLHNKTVIDKHNNTTIARLKELTSKLGDSENGLQSVTTHIQK